MIESFMKMKEVDSLEKQRLLLHRELEAEAQRVLKLQQRQRDTLQEIEVDDSLRKTKQSELEEAERIITQAEKQIGLLRDRGAEEEKMTPHQQALAAQEEKGLNLLTEIAALDEAIAERRGFLEGLQRTIQEIELEVAAKTEETRRALEQIEFRVSLLLEELPTDFRGLLVRVRQRNLAHGPFTRVDAGSCFFCRFKLSRLDESEIDMQKALKACNQCGRIFLPYGS